MIRSILQRLGLSLGSSVVAAPPPHPTPRLATSSVPQQPVRPAAPRRLASIMVRLPLDRDLSGVLEGYDADGAVVVPACGVIGRSDRAFADRMGNPGRDPLRPYGGVPYGEYHSVRLMPPVGKQAAETFGPHGTLLLMPISGDAALAEARGRTSLLHGGKPIAAAPGSLQVDDETMRAIVGLLPDAAEMDREPVVVTVEEFVAEHEEFAPERWGDRYASYDGGYVYGRNRADDDFLIQQMLLWQIIDADAAERGRFVEEAPAFRSVPPMEPPVQPYYTAPAKPDQPADGGLKAPAEEVGPAKSWGNEDDAAKTPIDGGSKDDVSPMADTTSSQDTSSWTPSGGAYDR